MQVHVGFMQIASQRFIGLCWAPWWQVHVEPCFYKCCIHLVHGQSALYVATAILYTMQPLLTVVLQLYIASMSHPR